VSENLWALREQKKLSVAALANRAGLPIGLIIEYESGQRSIDPRHLGRLARALYVEESDIKLQTDRRPSATAVAAPREPMREPASAPRPPAKPRERVSHSKSPPRPPAPARPSQITYLEGLLKRLNRNVADIETEIGRPLAGLDRPTASELIKKLQGEAALASPVNRHRAYLPEAVDTYEAQYLSAVQEQKQVLQFTLFDASTLSGRVTGFSPYSITIQRPDGSETTLNKLALVSYSKEAAT
jgi:transcriptional regulator with XRE-family HTH domain